MKIAGHTLHPINVHQIIESIFKKSQHKKRIAAIANAALGGERLNLPVTIAQYSEK